MIKFNYNLNTVYNLLNKMVKFNHHLKYNDNRLYTYSTSKLKIDQLIVCKVKANNKIFSNY